ncbi:InlB B-repeat-containing protein, partial [Candidatus Saccharibacteria bacterium]|nr:InlB B-repeat-containing protein [Candidatus Saccharibacteria bacterium]
ANSGASSLSNNTWGFRRHLAGGYGNWFAVGENESNGTIIDSTDEDDPVYCAESDFSYPLPNANCSSSAYNSYQIGFGAKLTSSLPAGTYTNNVVFSAVAKSEGTKYTMNFNANGGTNTMGSRTVLSGSNIVMPKTGFTKDGYRIKGWAMVNNATTSTTPIFLAGQTVAINDLIAAAQTAGQSPATTNSFTVYAVWDVPYTIAFDSNSGTGTMASQTIFQTDSSYTVPANGFTKEGYNFTGWALSASGSVVYSPADTPTVSSLISAAQTAGQTVTPGTAGTITLYAVWEEAVYMQGFNCNSRLPNIGDSTTAVDRRDNTTYNIKKLADGKCWMTDNLILGHDKAYTLTNEYTNIQDSDNGSYYLPQAGYRASLDGSNSGTATFEGTNDVNIQQRAHVQYRAQGSSGDVSSSGTLGQSTGYYNFYAATLGCSYYRDGLSQCVSGYIQKDICPKGWHLPTGGAGGQFAALDIALNPDDASAGTNRTNATARDRFLNQASFLYSGYYYSSQLYYVGSGGYWWSSTVYSTYRSYSLYLGSSGSVRPQDDGIKYGGFAVRCVAQ